MKKICLYITCITIFTCIGKPIKSNIGGRNAILVHESHESANSYIKEGLIAMWDGIENAGIGFHDNNASIWVDITGNGHNLTEKVGDCGWGENSFISLGGAIYSMDIGFAVNNGTYERTVELVSSGSRLGAWRTHLISMPTTSSTPWGTGHYEWTDGISVMAGYTFSSSISKIVATEQRIQDIIICKTILLSNSSCTLIVNCDKTIESSRMNYSSHHLALGNTAPQLSTMTDEVRIYCCRIYDRVLTEDEIRFNYEIDKVRFGL